MQKHTQIDAFAACFCTYLVQLQHNPTNTDPELEVRSKLRQKLTNIKMRPI